MGNCLAEHLFIDTSQESLDGIIKLPAAVVEPAGLLGDVLDHLLVGVHLAVLLHQLLQALLLGLADVHIGQGEVPTQ